jgi:hypothetical protein
LNPEAHKNAARNKIEQVSFRDFLITAGILSNHYPRVQSGGEGIKSEGAD